MLRNDGHSISEIGGGFMLDNPARRSLHKAKSNSSDKEARRRRMLEDNLLNNVVPPLVIPSHDIAALIGHSEAMRRENSKNASNKKSLNLG
jgi:hypothetical protein